MKSLLAVLLVATCALASAEPRPRKIQTMCGSLEEVNMTMEQFGEKLVMASVSPNQDTVNLLYVNFETQTSSWFIQDLENNEYCMIGVGNNIMIPKDSPLNTGTGIGKKTNYK